MKMDRSRLDQVLDVGMMRSQQPGDGLVFGTGNFGEIHDLATLNFLKMEVMQHRKQATDYYAGPRHRTMSLDANYRATLKALDKEERDLDKRIAEVSPQANSARSTTRCSRRTNTVFQLLSREFTTTH
jgi:hypothetical protein